jgi:hypothetical protein
MHNYPVGTVLQNVLTPSAKVTVTGHTSKGLPVIEYSTGLAVSVIDAEHEHEWRVNPLTAEVLDNKVYVTFDEARLIKLSQYLEYRNSVNGKYENTQYVVVGTRKDENGQDITEVLPATLSGRVASIIPLYDEHETNSLDSTLQAFLGLHNDNFAV